MNSRAKLSPKTALNALAVGHTLWGTYAYRDQLAGIVLDGPGSVGEEQIAPRHGGGSLGTRS